MIDADKVKILYNEARVRYSSNKRPNNYIPSYIKNRLDFDISNEDLYKIIHNIIEIPICEYCGKPVTFKQFSSGYPKFCSIHCSHKTEKYRKKFSEALKGKSKSTKGKTYFEIYGTDNPKCGFKKGVLNIAKDPEIRKKISEKVKESYTDELREIRRKAAYNNGWYKGTYALKCADSKGNLFRSSLESRFSDLLISNDISYDYEKEVILISKKRKIVDFVIDNIYIEISGYAYDKWKLDFNKKIKFLKEALNTNDFIILLTYPENVNDLMLNISKQHTGTNIFVGNVYDDRWILNTIQFIRNITTLNQIIK